MNKNLHILDCTLRDGAYVVDGNFGENIIKGVISNLAKANVDIIEVGWLKNPDYTNGTTYFHCAKDIEKYLPDERNNNQSYIAMLDYGRYDEENLEDYDGKSIDSVRIVFPKEKFNEAIDFSKKIKQKGYKICLQAANTSSYSDLELLKLVEKTNELTPESLSIVDTFGVMYPENLKHIFMILNKNLSKDIKIGLHSHNNLQMSFALAIEFMNTDSDRKLIIDSSLAGMGRGAGNLCTELITNYVNKKYHRNYDLNDIMDTIELYIKPFTQNYNWGYSIPYCIAGQLGSHVNNIAYLQNTHKTNYKDLKIILESIPKDKRKLYNYDYLEDIYINYQNKKINDSQSFEYLHKELLNKDILLLVPGKSLNREKNKISKFIKKRNNLVTISVNHISKLFNADFLFFSNSVRYNYAKTVCSALFNKTKKITLSNIKTISENNEYLINYNSLIKRGWKYFENSTVMLMRLLDKLHVNSISIAGFDGYDETGDTSYDDNVLQSALTTDEYIVLNNDINSMLEDFCLSSNCKNINYITESKFNKTLLTPPPNNNSDFTRG